METKNIYIYTHVYSLILNEAWQAAWTKNKQTKDSKKIAWKRNTLHFQQHAVSVRETHLPKP